MADSKSIAEQPLPSPAAGAASIGELCAPVSRELVIDGAVTSDAAVTSDGAVPADREVPLDAAVTVELGVPAEGSLPVERKGTAPGESAPSVAGQRLPRSPRYGSLDFWRGAACLMVVAFHSTQIASKRFVEGGAVEGGWSFALAFCACMWMGVPIFFVISGYCISASVDSARLRGHSLATYFKRRFRRIYPPYWIMFALCAVAVLAVDGLSARGILPAHLHNRLSPAALSPWQWLGNMTLTETWRHHLVGPPQSMFLDHAWSLCYEEQFYAVAGLLLFCGGRRFFPAALGVTVVALAVLFVAYRQDWNLRGFFFDGLWFTFAAGVLVYYQINYLSPARQWLAPAVCLAAAGVVGLFDWRGLFTFELTVQLEAVAAFLFAAVIALTHRWDASISTSRWLRPITFCGTMCYSLYLIHAPVVPVVSRIMYRAGLRSDAAVTLVVLPVCTLISVAMAWAFYRLVECRFMNASPRASSSS